MFLELGRESEKGLDDILVQDRAEVATDNRSRAKIFGLATVRLAVCKLASLWTAFLIGAVVPAAIAFCFAVWTSAISQHT